MADDVPNESGPFSVATVKALVQLMARHNVSEIDLRQGDQRIRLRRGGRVVTAAALPEPPVAAPAAPPPPVKAESAPPPAPARHLHEIKSEVIGTFYAAPEPNKPPFVQVGARVKQGDVLCLVEAMKTFNEVVADRPGLVVEVFVQNQQFVEYGQVLFRLDPTA